MKTSHKWLACLCLCFGVMTELSAQEGVTIQHWSTSNGVPVYFVARPELAMLDVAVLFPAGSARDGQQWGLASYVAAMLNEGTAHLSAAQIAEAFDGVGAQFDANVDRDMAQVHLRTITKTPYYPRATALFSQMLSQSTFPEEAVKRVRGQALDAIQQALQAPDQVAEDTFFSKLYAGQPYGHPVLGTAATVQSITRDQLLAFYRQYYVAQNAKIVLVGALTREAAEALAQQLAQVLQRGTKTSSLPINTSSPVGGEVFLPMSVSQNAILMGAMAINRQDPDYFNLIVANYVLGGSSMNSLLFDTVRNKQGLAYSVYSGFSALQAKGPFVIVLQTRATAVTAALSLVRDTLAHYLESGPSATALQLAQRDLIHSFPLKVASNQGVLAQVVAIAFYGLPLDYLLTYPKKIAAVTVTSAKQAFSSKIHPSSFTTVVVGAATSSQSTTATAVTHAKSPPSARE